MKLFGVIALLFILTVHGGTYQELKKVLKKSKQIVKKVTEDIVIEPARDLCDIVPNKQASNIVDSAIQPHFTMTQPIVAFQHLNFDVESKAELNKKFKELGLFSPYSFMEICFYLLELEKFVVKFYIPDVNVGDNVVALSLRGIEATKNEDDSASMKVLELSARCTVTAVDIIHWRTVVKEYLDNQEMKTQAWHGSREIQTLIDTLTKAIKDDPRYKELPVEIL